MNKSLIDYALKSMTLLTLSVFLLVVYIRSSEASWLLLVGSAASGSMLILYGVFYFNRRRLMAQAERKKPVGRIRPRNQKTDSNQSLRAVQVSGGELEKIRIGKDYYYGRGLPKDFTVAFNYLFDGAMAGDAEAQMLVGRMFQYGQGVGQNTAHAITWLEAAAFQGNTEAGYQLGKIYSQNPENATLLLKSYYFLQNAAGRGHQEAAIRLKELGKKHPLPAPLKGISDESFFDVEHNPFIRAICIDQLEHEPVPHYTADDVKKCFRFFDLSPTADLDKVHHQYMALMIRYHPDLRNDAASRKKILMVRRAYDILEHYITTHHKKES
ncbi:MAG: hypothetical protein IJ523_04815 [Succinivibrionaceae bacterium]|nr:hypothetical protein [Succinivibrionaceae bacterium]